MNLYELAELMHTKFCRDPHDADCFNCRWELENLYHTMWKSNDMVHKQWLDKAMFVHTHSNVSLEDIGKVIEAL